MSHILVRFAYPMDNSAESTLVPSEVFDAGASVVHTQSIPLAWRGARLEKDLPPGEYLVRVVLPSGEMLGQTVSLQTDKDTEAMFKTRRQSPRESLAWAYYFQSGPRNSETPGSFDRWLTAQRSGLLTEPLEVDFWEHTRDGWSTLRGLGRKLVPGPQLVEARGDSGPIAQVRYDLSVRSQAPDALAAIEVDLGNWRAQNGQVWIRVRIGDGSRFLALPPASTIRVLVLDAEPSAIDVAPFRVAVGGINNDAASLLGFLSNGDFESARRVGTQWLTSAEKMLREKLEDPIAATIAGYFLLRAGELARLHEWTRNLSDWFPWLPDGPVIRAWHLLTLDKPSFENVRDSLLEAAARGVPFYTQGLRLLYDGLMLLQRQRSDPRLQGAIETVRPYAGAALWHSAVTSFEGDEPDSASLVRSKRAGVGAPAVAVQA